MKWMLWDDKKTKEESNVHQLVSTRKLKCVNLWPHWCLAGSERGCKIVSEVVIITIARWTNPWSRSYIIQHYDLNERATFRCLDLLKVLYSSITYMLHHAEEWSRLESSHAYVFDIPLYAAPRLGRGEIGSRVFPWSVTKYGNFVMQNCLHLRAGGT